MKLDLNFDHFSLEPVSLIQNLSAGRMDHQHLHPALFIFQLKQLKLEKVIDLLPKFTQ